MPKLARREHLKRINLFRTENAKTDLPQNFQVQGSKAVTKVLKSMEKVHSIKVDNSIAITVKVTKN